MDMLKSSGESAANKFNPRRRKGRLLLIIAGVVAINAGLIAVTISQNSQQMAQSAAQNSQLVAALTEKAWRRAQESDECRDGTAMQEMLTVCCADGGGHRRTQGGCDSLPEDCSEVCRPHFTSFYASCPAMAADVEGAAEFNDRCAAAEPAFGAGGLSLFEFSSSSTPWRVTDDTVMGGVSHSTFKVIGGVGVFVGEVKTVPFLQAPGTCQANSATFASADASEYDAIEIKLISKAALKQFQSSWTGPFVPEPPHSPFYRRKAYKAPFNVIGTGAIETIVLPMTAYTSSYEHSPGAVGCTPEHPEVCPSSKTQSSITEVGIDAQGTNGKFDLKIVSIRAIRR